MMKAYVLHGVNDLRYEDAPVPDLKERTALVKVHACGICGSDIPRIYKNGTYHFPTIPGHEFSGEVVSVYDENDVNEKSWLGKRVGVFPLIPCMKCPQCLKKSYEMCGNYSYLGSREDGGFAEYVRVPLWNLIELPDEVSYEQAAMMEPMAVAVHAIRQCFKGDYIDGKTSIAVCGMGTVGNLVSMFLKGMGFENVTELKKTEKAEDNSVDIFFECVGKNEAVLEGLNAAVPGGRVQLVGNPASDMELPRDIYWKILRKQLTLTGTWNSSYTHDTADDWNYVIKALKEGKIHPEKFITHRISMADGGLMRGFELMRDKSEPYTKVMGLFS